MNQKDFPVEIAQEVVEPIRRLLARKGSQLSFLRIGVKGGGCSGLEYVVRVDDALRESDLIHEIDDVRIACDPKSAKFLEGAKLVYTGNLMAAFAFENPNAARQCGCGTSFTPLKPKAG